MAADKEVAIRKRQQIDASKKTMFLFVAGAAFLAGVALVVTIFLVQQIVFHARVMATKAGTIGTLEHNIKTAKELKDNIRVLETNEALGILKGRDGNSPLQVVLDALPAEPNVDALGASLQQKFIAAVPGLTLESLAVEPLTTDGDQPSDSSLQFSLSVSGSAEKLKELLQRFERSIRVIEITSAEIQAGEGRVVLSVRGKAFYQPAQEVNLEPKVVKP